MIFISNIEVLFINFMYKKNTYLNNKSTENACRGTRQE